MTLKSLFNASALIAIGMLAGRLLGLLREMLLANRFGTSTTADMAVILLILPDFITSAFIGSAASAALLPAFAARTPAQAKKLFAESLLVSLLLFSAIAIILWFTKGLVYADMPTGAWALTLLALPTTAATAILTAYLQYRQRFVIPAFANVIFNVIIISGLYMFTPSLLVLACAIALASLIRLTAHVAALSPHKPYAPEPMPRQLDKSLTILCATAMGTGLLSLLPVYLPYAFMAATGAGVAVFNYALKLILMPAVLLQTMAQFAVLPWLVSHRKNLAAPALAQLHGTTLQLAWLVSMLASLCLALIAHPLASLCYGHGEMTELDILRIAHGFTAGIAAMPILLMVTLLQSMLYAAQLVRPAFTASILQAVMILPLFWWASHAGVAPMLAAFAAIQAAPLFVLLPSCFRHKLIPRLRPKALLPSIVALIAFWPLMQWQLGQELSPLFAIACACATGGVSLIAGLLTYRLVTKATP